MSLPINLHNKPLEVTYRDYVRYIRSIDTLNYKILTKKKYIKKLSKFIDNDKNIIAGILDLYIYNDTLKNDSHNFTLTFNILKEINMFLCNSIEESKIRKSTLPNRVNPILIEKLVKSFLPVVTNTIGVFETCGRTYEYDDLYNYDDSEKVSELLLKLIYLGSFEKHNTLTCILSVTILHYNKTRELILPIEEYGNN